MSWSGFRFYCGVNTETPDALDFTYIMDLCPGTGVGAIYQLRLGTYYANSWDCEPFVMEFSGLIDEIAVGTYPFTVSIAEYDPLLGCGGSGSGSGEGPIQTECCADTVPATLYATFLMGSGSCPDLDSSWSIPLIHSGGTWSGSYTHASGDVMTISYHCENINGSGTYGWITTIGCGPSEISGYYSPGTESCDPINQTTNYSVSEGSITCGTCTVGSQFQVIITE